MWMLCRFVTQFGVSVSNKIRQSNTRNEYWPVVRGCGPLALQLSLKGLR